MQELLKGKGTRVIPLGGAGEFGANAMIVKTPGTAILIDYGLMFPPDRRQPGVDFYVNDSLLVLEQFPELAAVFVTHAHEDHIGGLPYLLVHKNLPVYTLPYTAKIIKAGCQYTDIEPDFHLTALNEPVTVGDITVEFIDVTHSIAMACALAVTTADGRIVHSGDFKVDPLPANDYHFQSEVLQRLGSEGVDLLVMDSTNAPKKGFCPSDHEILPHLEALIGEAPGRVFLTTFSSHMPHLIRLRQLAARCGRRISLVGRSFEKHFRAAIDTGYMSYTPGVFIPLEQALEAPDNTVLFVITGSQAEPRSALCKIMREGFKGLSLQAGDRVIFSSKIIPGNERAVMLLASSMERMGVEVISERSDNVHTSGHGYREDLAYLLSLTRPRFVAPIHGEFHQLAAHHHWLQHLAVDEQGIFLIEDGDVLCLHNGDIRHLGAIETGMLPIDGNQSVPLDRRTLGERKDMMYSGLVLINANTDPGASFATIQVDVHGLAEKERGSVAKALTHALEALLLNPDDSAENRAHLLFREARKALRRVFFGSPLIKLVLNGHIHR